MSRLAHGHRILYVNVAHPTLWTAIRKALLDKRVRERRLSWSLTDCEHVNGVEVLTVPGALFHRGKHNADPRRIRHQFDVPLMRLRRSLSRLGVKRPILWVYHPGYGSLPAELAHRLLVYDCVDEYSAFPAYRDDPHWLSNRERRLCERADLVVTTSRPLFDAKRLFNPTHTHLCHNVGDAEHFKTALSPETRVPQDIAALPRPLVIFVGAVSGYKLDTDWLCALARARPTWSVVVVGPVGRADRNTDISMLERQPNIHLLGHRAYELLPAYLKGADVAVIPYRDNAYTRFVFPIKFFELLASGIPVVISPLPSLKEHFEAVLVATSPHEFIQCCESALSDTEGRRQRRIALAEQNSWSARVDWLMELVDTRLLELQRIEP